ncbi:hypothetical protein AB1Y20_004405 [Prymnesium parvum]|uniref:EF-hand domain-containing protein n=1 Tax=Prymnesium parvum TaxID=97485 RepID=A0AB34IZ59_PRYPA
MTLTSSLRVAASPRLEAEAIEEEPMPPLPPTYRPSPLTSAILRRPHAQKNVPSRDAIVSSLRRRADEAASRLSPRELRDAKQKLKASSINAWLQRRVPSVIRDTSISLQRRQALQECFEVLDSDSSGTVNFSELGVAMKALGFKADSIRRAIMTGDKDGDGELSFDEFVNLITRAGGSAHPEDSSAEKTSDPDAFPFTLIVNSHRISRMVDAYDPVQREVQLKAMIEQPTRPRRKLKSLHRSAPAATPVIWPDSPRRLRIQAGLATPPLSPERPNTATLSPHLPAPSPRCSASGVSVMRPSSVHASPRWQESSPSPSPHSSRKCSDLYRFS